MLLCLSHLFNEGKVSPESFVEIMKEIGFTAGVQIYPTRNIENTNGVPMLETPV
jgi:hypothetical protein